MAAREPTDVLAEVLRINRHGLIRPLWADLDREDPRHVHWTAVAEQVSDALGRRGITLKGEF